MSAFWVEQKVACISDEWGLLAQRYLCCPVKGRVYTVRGKIIRPSTGDLHLLLAEIRNPIVVEPEGTGEPSWQAIYFRPLVDRKTDISVFKHLLDDAPYEHREEEDA